jgi:hypothetical protein
MMRGSSCIPKMRSLSPSTETTSVHLSFFARVSGVMSCTQILEDAGRLVAAWNGGELIDKLGLLTLVREQALIGRLLALREITERLSKG